MNQTPNTHSLCEDLGVCSMDVHCHRRFECASEAAHLPRNLPQPTAKLGEDGDWALCAEECQRLCWAAFCICVALLACAGTLALLWHFDTPLRAAAHDLVALDRQFFWNWAAING